MASIEIKDSLVECMSGMKQYPKDFFMVRGALRSSCEYGLAQWVIVRWCA